MNLQSIIDKKKEAAEYMVSEITHICKDFEKRDPGSKGEQQACEYMADVLKTSADAREPTSSRSKRTPVRSSAGYISRLPSFSRRSLFRSSIRSSR